MPTIRFNKREDFIAALEARRPWAQGYDKKITAKHKADEKAALQKFREGCRAAAKLSYDELKKQGRYGYKVAFDPPTCPDSAETKLNRHLEVLAATRQERFQVDDGGTWRSAYWLLTYDEDAPRTVC